MLIDTGARAYGADLNIHFLDSHFKNDFMSDELNNGLNLGTDWVLIVLIDREWVINIYITNARIKCNKLLESFGVRLP